ncbi:hypothetical protein VULLAG_LOCUS20789 [Vulpes lagopus]
MEGDFKVTKPRVLFQLAHTPSQPGTTHPLLHGPLGALYHPLQLDATLPQLRDPEPLPWPPWGHTCPLLIPSARIWFSTCWPPNEMDKDE